MARRISSSVFVGREAETVRARELLAEVENGASRTLLVAGESGVGKTRFVAVLAGIAEEHGFALARGRCLGSSSGVPFAAFREAFGTLAGEPAALMPHQPFDLDRLPVEAAGWSGGDRPFVSSDPAQAGGRLFELALGHLRARAVNSPLLVAIDDLHWAPASTLELFAFLAQNPSSAPVLLVGTHRTDVPRRHPMWAVLAELVRDATVERMTLPRLTAEEVRALIAAITTQPVRPGDAEALALRTGGNPLFVEELIASGSDPAGPLPESLREALQQRTLALSDAAREVVRAAAVAGAEVDERLLEAVTGRSQAELWEPLRELVDAHLMVADPDRGDSVYAFRHALLRDAVHADLLPGERVRQHARIAATLAEHPDWAVGGEAAASSAIADHWEAGRDIARAAPAHIQAGRLALRLYAYADAGRHLERAVELWDILADGQHPADERLSTLLMDAAEASALAGRQERAVELVRTALERLGDDGDSVEKAALLDRLAQYLWEVGDDAASLEARTTSLGLLPAARVADRARIMSSQASVLVVHGRHDEALAMATEALELSASSGNRAVEAGIRNTLGVLAAADGDTDGAIEQLGEARRIANEAGDAGELVRAYVNEAAVLGTAGRLKDAFTVADEGATIARQLGLFRPHGQFLVANALAALLALGHWDEAADLLATTVGDAGSGVIGAHIHLIEAQLATGRGQTVAARRALEVAERLAGHSQDRSLTVSLACTRAELDLVEDDPEHAWSLIQRTFERLGDGPIPPDLIAMAAHVAADRAQQSRARRDAFVAEAGAGLDALLERFTRGLDGGADPGSAEERALADAAAERSRLHGEAGAELYEGAALLHEAAGRAWSTAYARFRQAEAILMHSRVRTEAGEVLALAQATAGRLGAAPLLREIEALARRARIEIPVLAESPAAEPSVARPHDDLGLSERELEVLGLVAAGYTNRQIAEELFITPKTAGAHVSNILGKLGVSGRVEAATIAERAGLTKQVAPDGA